MEYFNDPPPSKVDNDLPSLYSEMVGEGTPLAVQVRLNSSPALIVPISLNLIIVGGSVRYKFLLLMNDCGFELLIKTLQCNTCCSTTKLLYSGKI